MLSRRYVLLSLSALMFVSLTAQQPPIIDRDQFFGDPEISGANISPDGKWVSFIKPLNGVRNIWVKGRTDAFEAARPLTNDVKRPVNIYFWSHDSRYVLYAQDKGGDENFRVYAVDPTASGDPVPPAKDLTPFEKVRAMIYSVPRDRPREIIVGLNDRRADLHDVYRINIESGERELLRKNEDNVVGWVTDNDGNLVLGVRLTKDGGSEILAVKGDSLASLYAVTNEETCSPVKVTPDGKKLYLLTNKGSAVDKMQLELMDMATGKTTVVETDPEDEVDLSQAMFSDMTDELIATVYVGDRVRVYPKTERWKEIWNAMQRAVPQGELGLAGSSADENLLVVSVSSDVDPGSRYLFDVSTGKADLLYRSRPDLNPDYLSPMKPVRYAARDGRTIPGYLTTPKGQEARSLPTVMLIHGGPWGRDTWGYDAEAQFFANRGYAVFQPNFRGSAGFGKEFLNAGNKQWGTGGMQHDISDAVRYLIDQGISDSKRIAIYGGSYGGYATLAGLAFTPELYAAGVSYVGPSNIVTLLNSIPPYWAPLKKIFTVRVGDLDDPADRAMLEKQSPLNSAVRIKAPLLVIQGANDPRVKKAESDQIVVAMRELGRKVEYLVATDEGHGFAGKENRLAMYAATEKFLSEHIGGRYQSSMTEEIRKRLGELTVNVATVSLPAPPKPVEAGLTTSFDGSNITPSKRLMNTTVNVMGQTFTMKSSRLIAKAMNGRTSIWRVTETTTGGPMGTVTDTLELDAETLLPLRHVADQGMGSIVMRATEEGFSGEMKSGPQSMPLNVTAKKGCLLPGGNAELALSTLPIGEGFVTKVDVVDVMRSRTMLMVFRVVGKERITVPAGTFDVHVVEFQPDEGEGPGGKLFLSVTDRTLVKADMSLPGGMGGTAVSELVKE